MSNKGEVWCRCIERSCLILNHGMAAILVTLRFVLVPYQVILFANNCRYIVTRLVDCIRKCKYSRTLLHRHPLNKDSFLCQLNMDQQEWQDQQEQRVNRNSRNRGSVGIVGSVGTEDKRISRNRGRSGFHTYSWMSSQKVVSCDSYCPAWATRQQLVRGSVPVPEQILGAKEKSRLDVKRLITLYDGATCSNLSIR